MKFIDSNILVYLADRHDGDKREIAKGVVADAMRYPEGYLISTQTLAEFANVCLRKFKMDIETVRDYLCLEAQRVFASPIYSTAF